jgi:hypothetical protein
MAADSVPKLASLEDRGLDRAEADLNRRMQRTPAAPGFRLRPLAELLADQRPPDWLVRGHLERGDSAILFGPSGHGKSFVAIDLAACIATGTPWHGFRVAQGPVIYLAGEGHRGISRRFMAWSIARGIPLDRAQVFVSDAGVSLTDDQSAAAVRAAIAAIGSPPALCVIDTLARHYGLDENSNSDMGRFVATVDAQLRHPFACATLVVHHTGHAEPGRERGAVALRAAAEWSVLCTKDNASVLLDWRKAKDHEIPKPMGFQLVEQELPIADADGRPVTSAFLHRMDMLAPKIEGLGDNQSTAYSALCRLEDEHRANVAASGRDPLGARVDIRDWRKASGLDRFAWRCYETLVSRGLVLIEHPYAWTKRPVSPPASGASPDH